MSAAGHERHFERASAMSAIPPIATESLHCDKRRSGPTTEAIQSRRVMTGEIGPVEHQLFLIGSGDTGSYSQTTMVLFYGRAPRK